MEEIDLCWRLQNLGQQIYYHGGSTVFHVGGGTLNKTNPRKTFLNFRNGVALLYKNLAPKELNKVLYTRMVLDGVAAVQFFLKGEWKEVQAIWRAHRSFFSEKGYWQKKREKNKALQLTGQLIGWYPKSVVWQYFVKGKKTFRALDVPDGASLPA